jgi:hypothetical protein
MENARADFIAYQIARGVDPKAARRAADAIVAGRADPATMVTDERARLLAVAMCESAPAWQGLAGTIRRMVAMG